MVPDVLAHGGGFPPKELPAWRVPVLRNPLQRVNWSRLFSGIYPPPFLLWALSVFMGFLFLFIRRKWGRFYEVLPSVLRKRARKSQLPETIGPLVRPPNSAIPRIHQQIFSCNVNHFWQRNLFFSAWVGVFCKAIFKVTLSIQIFQTKHWEKSR